VSISLFSEIEHRYDTAEKIINKYTDEAEHTCEFCACKGKIQNVNYWASCVCNYHLRELINDLTVEEDKRYTYTKAMGEHVVKFSDIGVDDREIIKHHYPVQIKPKLHDSIYAYYFNAYLVIKDNKTKEFMKMQTMYLRSITTTKKNSGLSL